MSHDTRETILEAAERVLHREGITRLTLDAVAREAGVSKGGLLYHFPSKQALISGMIDTKFSHWEAMMARMVAADPLPRGRWCRAFAIGAILHPEECPVDVPEERRETEIALFTASLTEPQFRQTVQTRYNRIRERLENDGLPLAVVTQVRLMVDGIHLNHLFGLTPLDREERRYLLEAILAVIERGMEDTER